MTAFTFRLEPLLRLRTAERDRRREELAKAFRAELVLQQQQQAVEDELQVTRQEAQQQSAPGPIHVDPLLHAHRYALLLQAHLAQLRRQQLAVRQEIDRRREALVEADRELRILEKLKERHLAAHVYQEQRADLRTLDEIALRRRPGRSEVAQP
ncbi:MAG: flagellar export protein FliJ [Pirellulaceae bacterium]|nr:flagellar export protein FliJ [Pirellulaceae bacterium]